MSFLATADEKTGNLIGFQRRLYTHIDTSSVVFLLPYVEFTDSQRQSLHVYIMVSKVNRLLLLGMSLKLGSQLPGLEPDEDLRLCRSHRNGPPEPPFRRSTPPGPSTCHHIYGPTLVIASSTIQLRIVN